MAGNRRNGRRAAVVGVCLLAACAGCILFIVHGGLRPSRPPEQLGLSARRGWTGAIRLERYGGAGRPLSKQEMENALAFCNSCILFPQEEGEVLMLGMEARYRQLVLT